MLKASLRACFLLYTENHATIAWFSVYKNQHGGPAMLSVYLESFYSKYICKPLALLPALNGIFLFAGGLLAICANGEKRE